MLLWFSGPLGLVFFVVGLGKAIDAEREERSRRGVA
jgi:hypothetical protein